MLLLPYQLLMPPHASALWVVPVEQLPMRLTMCNVYDLDTFRKKKRVAEAVDKRTAEFDAANEQRVDIQLNQTHTWLEDVKKRNEANAKREEEERLKANKNTLRSYRITPKK